MASVNWGCVALLALVVASLACEVWAFAAMAHAIMSQVR